MKIEGDDLPHHAGHKFGDNPRIQCEKGECKTTWMQHRNNPQPCEFHNAKVVRAYPTYITEADIGSAVSLREQGDSLKQIGDKLRCSRTKVTRILNYAAEQAAEIAKETQ